MIIRSIILSVLLIQLSWSYSLSQTCLPNGITFTTQDQIDSFPMNYPGCTEIEGDLTIGGYGNSSIITNLAGLSNLTTVGGDLNIGYNNALTEIVGLSNLTTVGGDLYIIYNGALTNLAGLSNLTTVGGDLYIIYNGALTNLAGLSNLTTIGGDLEISYNAALTDIAGLSNLTTLDGVLKISSNDALTDIAGLSNLTTLDGDLYIYGNDALTDIAGLSNLTTVGGILTISNNGALTDIAGLSNLNSVGGYLTIWLNDALTDITGLSNLTTVGSHLKISNNGALTDIAGLSNLTTLDGDLYISGNGALTIIAGLSNLTTVDGDLYISGNDALTDIAGLSNLTTVGGILTIYNNAALTDIAGLSNLNSVGGFLTIWLNDALTEIAGLSNLTTVGGDLRIYDNDALTDCCGIKHLLSTPGAIGGIIYIYNNPSECSSESEILAADCNDGLSGTVFFDYNQNKIQDPNEAGIPNQQIGFENEDLEKITNINGEYYQFCDSGSTYQISWVPDADWMLTTDPSTYTIQFHPDSINNQYDFGLYPNFTEHAGTIILTSNPTRCNTDVNFYVRYQNTGTSIEKIDVVIHYDPTSSLVSISPDLDYEIDTIEHEITWTIDSLYPFDFEDYVLLFAMPDENSTGERMSFNAEMYDSNGEFLAGSGYRPIVLCSYDPNDKLVMPPGVRDEHYTLHDQTLTYTVRFQNTGNAEAIDITILDTIDTDLDMSTFRVLNSSFPVQTSVKDNAIEFFFHNIWLPDSTSNEPESHGFVTYEINPIAGLSDYSEINNTAHIIFDFNPPIVTNTTKNTMVTMIPVGIFDAFSQEIDIRPNPTSGLANIRLPKTKHINNILIYNQLGQLILQSKDPAIDVSHLPKGVYVVKAKLEVGQAIGKLVVE